MSRVPRKPSPATVVAVIALALLAATATAGAHTTSTPSTIDVVGWSTSPGASSSDYAHGVVESPSGKCIRGRTVKIFMQLGGSTTYTLVDTDRTSKKGFWAGGGREGITSTDSKAKVTSANVGRGDHKHICSADVVLWD